MNPAKPKGEMYPNSLVMLPRKAIYDTISPLLLDSYCAKHKKIISSINASCSCLYAADEAVEDKPEKLWWLPAL